MELELRRKGIAVGKTMRERIADSVEAAVQRFAKRIRRVTVYLVDVNGPHGGVDKRCRITVELTRGRTIRAGHAASNLVAAVNSAIDRVTHALGREMHRRHRRATRGRPWTPRTESSVEG